MKRNYLSRISAILVAVLMLTCMAAGAGTIAYGDTETETKPVDPLISIESNKGGTVEVDREVLQGNGNDVELTNVVPTAALPAAYQTYETVKTKYPWTRDQNPYGTCWAFAAVACAEFDLINEGSYPNSGISNFSELQLAYNMYHTGNDVLGNLSGDYIYPYYSDHLNTGGNIYWAQNILANWRGLAHEDVVPYSQAANVDSYMSGSNAWRTYHNNCARLVNSREIPISKKSAVKQAIMDHGAVHASYYHNSSYFSTNGYTLYFCPGDYTINHSIAIVGWNDNHPASSYPVGCQPSSNGAWLVRNSWSSTITSGSEYTYFWMSYEDASLDESVFALDFEPAANNYYGDNNYDHIYQHDGSPAHASWTLNAAANVFKAANNNDASGEFLEAVMVSFTNSKNNDIKVKIYTDLSDSSDPQSGYLQRYATTSYSTTYPGIYKIELEEPVYLAPGTKYAVVVEAQDDGLATFDIEWDAQYSGIMTTVASSTRGESFIRGYDGYDWSDCYDSGYGNMCIKALTNDSSMKAPTLKATNVSSSGKPKLSWNKVSGADKYLVYRSTSKNGSYTYLKTTTGSTYTDTSAKAETLYYYRVKAVDTDKDISVRSDVVSRRCDLARPVISTTCVASSGKPKVTWKAVSGADKYVVYRATSENGTYKKMLTTTSRSYTNTSATPEKKYYYKVKAISTKASSANSAFSTVKSRICDLARPVTTISRTSAGNPKLTWKSVSYADKYEIYRATSKSGTYKKMYTTTKTSYVNLSATAGKTYYYKVKAISTKTSSANSAYSTVKYITAK